MTPLKLLDDSIYRYTLSQGSLISFLNDLGQNYIPSEYYDNVNEFYCIYISDIYLGMIWQQDNYWVAKARYKQRKNKTSKGPLGGFINEWYAAAYLKNEALYNNYIKLG